MIGLIRVEQRCARHEQYLLQSFSLSYDRICTFNVSVPPVRAVVARIENGHIKSTNPIIRKSKALLWVLIMMCATLIDPNQPNQCFAASPVRARGCQIRAPKKGILGGLSRDSSPPHVTVYPYNGCIRGTNPIT